MLAANSYRPEIDGLRTISVLAVILYHYDFGPFSGGFVGVDVFFVISGYLITSIIFAEMQKGKFSLWAFYDRRVRRILPASLLTIVATGIAGYFILLPSDYAAFGGSAIASAFGLANFYFLWNSGGYFDNAADLMPLLHMWSLGVEEQFYIFWPILLWGIVVLSKGSAKAASTALILIIAVSFGTAVYLTRTDQPVAFYMLHTRAWELAVGALLVFAPRIGNRLSGEAVATLGLALIFGSIFLLTSKMPFPGWNALYPCLGAALIIWPKTTPPFTEWLLRQRPVTFIGLISFSLYLWHWPVLVLYRQMGVGEMPPYIDRVLLVCLAVALSVASYWFVEQPMRKWRPQYKRSVAAGLAAMTAVAVAGNMLSVNKGLASRLPPEVRQLERYRAMTAGGGLSPCFLTTRSDRVQLKFDPKKCLEPDSQKPTVLVVGDSHAAHFMTALRAAFPEISFSQANASGCRPVIPVRGLERCADLMRKVFSDYAREFDAVVLSSRWPNDSIKYLRNTADKLSKSSKVFVLGPSLEYRVDLPVLLAKAELSGKKYLIAENARYDVIARRSKAVERALRGSGAEYYSVLKVTCPKRICKDTVDGVPMMSDESHFTPEGAAFAVQKLKAEGFLSNIAKKKRL